MPLMHCSYHGKGGLVMDTNSTWVNEFFLLVRIFSICRDGSHLELTQVGRLSDVKIKRRLTKEGLTCGSDQPEDSLQPRQMKSPPPPPHVVI